ncbi:MAG: hypothetical protein ACW964_06305 [Candidatus Hodarchaeales archaeon]
MNSEFFVGGICTDVCRLILFFGEYLVLFHTMSFNVGYCTSSV